MREPGKLLRRLRLPARAGTHLRQMSVAYAVLLGALGLSILAWYYVYQDVEAQARLRFDDTSFAVQQAIDRRVDGYVDSLLDAGAFFEASEEVTREEWRTYVSAGEPEERFPGTQALGYAELVEPGEVEDYLERAVARPSNESEPEIRPRGEREVYFPALYVEPAREVNLERFLNYDLYFDEVHQNAMDRARDTGLPSATEMVYLPGKPGLSERSRISLYPGFLVYVPVYREGAPRESIEERREALTGFVFGAYNTEELLNSVLDDRRNPDLDFEVYDGTFDGRRSETTLLHDEDGVMRAGGSATLTGVSRFGTLDVAGRTWSLFFSDPDHGGSDSALPLYVLLSGLSISAVLFGVTWMLVRSRAHAERVGAELEAANRELEAFNYSVSHDLRAPLTRVDGFSRILLEDYADRLDEEGRDYLGRVRASSRRMSRLIDDLLDLSRLGRQALQVKTVDLSAIAREVAHDLRERDPGRKVEFVIGDRIYGRGDPRLLRVTLENLLGNAWKFSAKNERATIEFGVADGTDPEVPVYYVRDDGAGFEPAQAEKLFGAFQRLHSDEDFEGTGIGLATVQRVIRRHGGRVWAEGAPERGATFYFTLG